MTSPRDESRDLTEQEKAEINRDLIDAFKEAILLWRTSRKPGTEHQRFRLYTGPGCDV